MKWHFAAHCPKENSYLNKRAIIVIFTLFFTAPMIHSMTGFGKASAQLDGKKITVEIKSLNSKGLDLNVRVPQQYRELELDLRNKLSSSLQRGKIDFNIYLENTTEVAPAKVNVPIVKLYVEQLKQVYHTEDTIELLKMAVRMPEALKTEREDIDASEYDAVAHLASEAMDDLIAFRRSEGVALEKEFLHRIANIMTLMNEALHLDGERLQTVKTRLRTAVAELKEAVDENRFEQELIFYLEKYDITEEKVRLENHLNYFIETLAGQEANGRKLGFIAQEMGREINTMGSKANHAGMQRLVVQMKDELEKIKEQILNVL